MNNKLIIPPGVRKIRKGGVEVIPGPSMPRRGGPLGQIDSELNYGPKALEWGDVPADLRERDIKEYKVLGGQFIPEGTQVPTNDLLQRILNDTNAIASTLVLDRGLLGRVVLVTSTPQLIVRAEYLRGYLFLNPASAVGLTTAGTLVSSTSLVGATTLSSSSLGVANYNTLRLMLNVTAFAGAGPVTFDAQTLDPVTGTTFITSQSSVFSVTGTGNFYANLGTFGVDTDFRIFVTVPAGTTITFSMGFVLKDGLEGTSAGAIQTIFLGQAGVSSDVGYPLLNGKERGFYLKQNTELYAVTAGPTLPLRVFEL